jgi:hypothetical protein
LMYYKNVNTSNRYIIIKLHQYIHSYYIILLFNCIYIFLYNFFLNKCVYTFLYVKKTAEKKLRVI